jgi:hypothetical protein
MSKAIFSAESVDAQSAFDFSVACNDSIEHYARIQHSYARRMYTKPCPMWIRWGLRLWA